MRLRSITFLLFFIIGLFPLAASIIINQPRLLTILEKAIQEQRLARLQDEFVALERSVEQGRETLRVFGMLSETVDLVGRPEPGIPLELLRERLSDVVAKRWFRNRPEVLSVYIIDGLGQEQFRVSRQEYGELRQVSARYLDTMDEEMYRKGRLFMPGTTFIGAIQGIASPAVEKKLYQVVAHFGVPVQNEAYGTSGIAVLELDLRKLINKLEEYDLVSQDGSYLNTAIHDKQQHDPAPGKAFVNFPRLQHVMHDGKPAILKNYHGEAYAWLPLISEAEGQSSLWVGQPVDRSVIEIWLQQYKRNLAIIIFVLVVLLAGISLLMAQYANRLQGQLMGGLASILAGKKKPGLNWRWPKEHAQLAADLDALAEKYLLDNAARKAAEEEVGREKEHALVTLRSIGDAVIATDTEGMVTRMNLVAEQLTGWPQAEAFGRQLEDVFAIIDAGTREKSENPVQRVLETGKIVGLGNHTVLIARDGREYQVADSAAPILGQDGVTRGVVLVFRDVTEEYAIQKQLAHELAVKQALADLAGKLVGSGQSLTYIAGVILDTARELTVSPHGYVGIIDFKTGNLVCYAFTEILGDRWQGHREGTKLSFPPGPDEHYCGLWGVVIQEGRGSYNNAPGTLPVSSPILSDRPQENVALERFLAVPVILDGQVVGQITVANAGHEYTQRDLDLLARVVMPFSQAIKAARASEERERLMVALRQSQKMEAIGTLAGGVAHDFNNMLTPILGYTEMVMARLPPEDTLCHELGEVKKAALRAKNLIQQILAFSRQKGPELVCVSLPPVLEECLKMLHSILPATIVWREDIEADCGKVMADPVQIQQILINLCTNAAHAMTGSGGTLEVSLREIGVNLGEALAGQNLRAGKYLRLVVSDTGCGMDKATMERIFEPYFTTKEQGRGTGIGLALVHGIVKAHEGCLSVYSEPGQGTTFSLYFPVCCDVGEESHAAVNDSLPRGSERILLVDDDEAVLEMIKEMSEYLGYQVEAVSDSTEAYARFSRSPEDFDLVVTDQTMPCLTGIDLAQKIFALEPRVKIIVCTGFSEALSEEKATELGFSGYLMKPVVMADFARVVRRALEGGTK